MLQTMLFEINQTILQLFLCIFFTIPKVILKLFTKKKIFTISFLYNVKHKTINISKCHMVEQNKFMSILLLTFSRTRSNFARKGMAIEIDIIFEWKHTCRVVL